MLKGRAEITSYGMLIISKQGVRVAFDKDFSMIATSNQAITNPDFRYFFLMKDAERKLVQKWYVEQRPKNQKQEKFLTIVGEALENVRYPYRIATLEPIRDCNSRINYFKGCDPYNQVDIHEWEKKAVEFGRTKYESGLATLYELFLWYAYRVAMGYWTLEDICTKAKRGLGLKRVGADNVGGFFDGVLNTYKIVKDPKGDGFFIVGRELNEDGDENSLEFCITNVIDYAEPHFVSCYEVGVIALRGENI